MMKESNIPIGGMVEGISGEVYPVTVMSIRVLNLRVIESGKWHRFSLSKNNYAKIWFNETARRFCAEIAPPRWGDKELSSWSLGEIIDQLSFPYWERMVEE